MSDYMSFLNLEELVSKTLKREEQELNCGVCPEREYCISGEPVAIPCPAHNKPGGTDDDFNS